MLAGLSQEHLGAILNNWLNNLSKKKAASLFQLGGLNSGESKKLLPVAETCAVTFIKSS